MKAYVVFGEAGVCADLVEWMVGAFVDEEKAKERIVELKAIMLEIDIQSRHTYTKHTKDEKKQDSFVFSVPTFYMERKSFEHKMRTHEKGDPLFSCDDGGVRYTIKNLDIPDYHRVSMTLTTKKSK